MFWNGSMPIVKFIRVKRTRVRIKTCIRIRGRFKFDVLWPGLGYKEEWKSRASKQSILTASEESFVKSYTVYVFECNFFYSAELAISLKDRQTGIHGTMLQICLHDILSAVKLEKGKEVTNVDEVSMISLKWRYKKSVVIHSTYREVEEGVKVCRRKQLFRSLLKSTREGSEELKNATRRRQKNLRKGREQNLAHKDLPPSDKCVQLEKKTYFSS